MVNEASVLVTDKRNREQRKTTYADIVRRIGVSKMSDTTNIDVEKSTRNKSLERERIKLVTSLTFKK
jgi:hypothetical protein